MITFFYTYNLIIYFHRYTEAPKDRLVAVGIGLIVFLWIFVSFGLSYNGSTYILESLLGGVFGFAYMMVLIYFDGQIHELCENTGFIVKQSRKYKFYVFFACLGLLSFAIIYYNADLTNWRVEQKWILNIMKSCPNAYFDYRIGIDYTFEDTCILFSMIGAGFGVSFATANFNSVYWSDTSRFKRFLRAFIGGIMTVGIYLLSSFFPYSDHITMYCFRYALPHLI